MPPSAQAAPRRVVGRAALALLLLAGNWPGPATADAPARIDRTPRSPPPLRVIAAPGPAASGPRRVGWGAGEAMTYRIRVAGIEVGRAAVRVGEPRGRRLRMRGLGETVPFVALLHRVREELVSWVDLDSLLPIRTSSRRHEQRTIVSEHRQRPPGRSRRGGPGLLERTTVVRQTIERHPQPAGTEPRPPQRSQRQRRISAPLFDPLTALFFVRSSPLASDRELVFHLLDGTALYRVRLRLDGRERVYTTLGPVHCLRVKGIGRRIGDDGQPLAGRRPRRGLLWLTDDARRVPVQIKGDTDFGFVTGELASYEPARQLVSVRLPRRLYRASNHR